jgi:hypothetical protein
LTVVDSDDDLSSTLIFSCVSPRVAAGTAGGAWLFGADPART